MGTFIGSCTSSPHTQIVEPEYTLNRYEFASIHMGSRCSIVLYAPTETQAAQAAREAFDEIAKIDQAISDYNPESESMQAAVKPPLEWIPVSDIFLDVLERSKEMYELSDGAFDPTIGPVTHAWRKRIGSNMPPPNIHDADGPLSRVGFEGIEIDSVNQRVRFLKAGMILDFGGIGKGYAADCALEVLRNHGYSSAMVELGGDIALGDAPPMNPDGWVITVDSGFGNLWTVSLENSAIATSGVTDRFYEVNGQRVSHIFDPRSGRAARNQFAVTVIAADATTADTVASIVSVTEDAQDPKIKSKFPGIEIKVTTPPFG